jgi:LysR family glycine cleavage system transcriptional activator
MASGKKYDAAMTSHKRKAASMHEQDSPVSTRIRALPLVALRSFDVAAQLGSFRAAAQAIGLTPSAVSHQIKDLEYALGVALFQRQGRSVVLSEAGARLAPHVRQGFIAFERGATAVRGGTRARQIRVSSLALFSQTVLIPNLCRFTNRWRDYDVRIESTPRFVDFDREDVDIGIRVGGGRWPGLKCSELLRITGAPVGSRAYLRAIPIVEPGDLVKARLIHDLAQPKAWQAWLEARGVTRPPQEHDLWFDSAPATLHAAEQELGVALAIDPLVRSWPEYNRKLTLAFPDGSGPRTRYWLVRRPEADADPKIRAFVNWVHDSCRPLRTLEAK